MNSLEIRSASHRASMYYGLFLGLFLLVRFVVEVLGLASPILSSFYFVLSVAIPFLAYFFLKRFWKAYQEPPLSYGQVLSFHFFLFFFASLILTLAQYIFYQYIDPTFLNSQYQALLTNFEVMKQVYPPFADLESQIMETGAPSASQMSIQSIWMYSMGGFCIGLINAWIFTSNHKKIA